MYPETLAKVPLTTELAAEVAFLRSLPAAPIRSQQSRKYANQQKVEQHDADHAARHCGDGVVERIEKRWVNPMPTPLHRSYARART